MLRAVALFQRDLSWSLTPVGSVEPKRILIVELEGGVLVSFLQIKIANGEHVKLCTHKAAKRVFWRAYDRLPAHIEAGIDQNGAAGLSLECGQQGMEARVGLGVNGLNPR